MLFKKEVVVCVNKEWVKLQKTILSDEKAFDAVEELLANGYKKDKGYRRKRFQCYFKENADDSYTYVFFERLLDKKG